MDAPCRHLRIFLFPHKVDLGRADIGVPGEFRCPLGVAAAICLNLRAVHGRSFRVGPIMLRPMARRQRCRGEPAPVRGSGRPGPHASRSRSRVSARAAQVARDRTMSKSSSTRKRATRASSPTGENEILPIPPAARSTEPKPVEAGGVPASLGPQGRGPESLPRDDLAPRLLPLAGAGPADRHRLGRLARSRAATCGLGLRGLAARVFGPRKSCRQRRLPARVGTLSVRVSSFTTVMSRTVPSATGRDTP